mgnify:CR=1 FL=1
MKLKSEYLFSGTLSIVCTFVIFSFLSCNKEIPQINSFQSNINQENLNMITIFYKHRQIHFWNRLCGILSPQ